MKDEKDKELDDLFRRRLEDPVDPTGYREEDWEGLEQMLNKHKKRGGMVYWLPFLSGAAALLLLFFGWWIFRPTTTNHPKEVASVVIHHQQATTTHPKEVASVAIHQQQAHTGTSDGSIRQTTVHKQTTALAANYAKNSNVSKVSGSQSFLPLSAVGSRRDTAGSQQVITPEREFAATLEAASTAPFIGQESINAPKINSADIPRQFANAVKGASASRDNKIKVKASSAFRPSYAITVLAAPDINGVGSFQQSKVGTNIGMLFSAGIFKRLTVSTGVLYSDKPYLTAFENYHTPYQFSVDPTNVSADCRMLDIPLNVGYQLYNKHQNKFSIGTGLSSYIMLRENFTFNYANPSVTGPTYFDVPNSNKYFFGILNLNATYEHQINSKVGLSIQPYLKLPLTNIGYSQVRLQTTGVAVGLSWNLNSFKR